MRARRKAWWEWVLVLLGALVVVAAGVYRLTGPHVTSHEYGARPDEAAVGEAVAVAAEPEPPPAPAPAPVTPTPPAPPGAQSREGTPPVDVTLTERDHGFTPALSYALSRPLQPNRTYDLWITGGWRPDALVRRSEEEVKFLPATLTPAAMGEPLTVSRLSEEPTRTKGMSHLHAFTLSEQIGTRLAGTVTLHIRDVDAGFVERVELDASRHPLVLERGLSFDLTGLDPEQAYRVTLEGAASAQVLSLWGDGPPGSSALSPRLDGVGSFVVFGQTWARFGLIRGSGAKEVRLRVEEDSSADLVSLRKKRLERLER